MTRPTTQNELLDYFGPLASSREVAGEVVTLRTPEVNILALNSAYLEYPAQLKLLPSWAQKPQPLVVASSFVVPNSQEVGAVRIGTFTADAAPTAVVVEQVSRLQLGVWASVLAEAYDTPEWAGDIARHLAAKLETDRASTLLLAYADSEAVGALLWRRSQGGAAHLWGTLDASVDHALLSAAAHLSGGPLRVSLPDSSPIKLPDEQVILFSLVQA